MAKVYLGIGSNEGEREANIKKATSLLDATPYIMVKKLSKIFETDPVGPYQGKFMNGALELDTELEPHHLLFECKKIESELGRTKEQIKWGPRPIDLDILLYEDKVVRESDLIIPHPLMHKRLFVLEPLLQIAPDEVHPVFNKTIKILFEQAKNENNSKS